MLALAAALLVLLVPTHCLAPPVPVTADVVIVGCGVLGSRVGARLLTRSPELAVVAETGSERTHGALRDMGMVPRVRAARPAAAKATHVVYCAPPSAVAGSGSATAYADDVAAAAAECWAGPGGGGSFVFTSSGAVYAEDGGGAVHEASALSEKPRAARLLGAEAAARSAGGSVVRLAGLYTATRGMHSYWWSKAAEAAGGVVPGDAEGLVNTLHYDDAASAVVAALQAKDGPATYLVADDAPSARGAIVAAATALPMEPFSGGGPVPRFAGPDDGSGRGTGKTYDTALTRRLLSWAPEHATFPRFCESVVAGAAACKN